MELRILPRNVADMIAAGEVVQRPASVVKELMENAVDAGASDIKVVVTDAGRTLIQVIDDGIGMSPDDALLCFERHATSKLASAEDLHHILSFGFRGEALSSIAAVAEVTLRTRRRGEELGVEVQISASENLGTREVACPEGSNFSVRNLFYNIPARRKFLKSDNVELRHIVEEFQRVALTRPDLAFSLSHNGKDIHVLKPAKSLKFRIQDLLGAAAVGELSDFAADTTIATVRGFVGRPESARKTLGNQFFFVNGRYFRSPYLHKAVLKAYENLIPEGTAPSYFIYIEVDPSEVDVNIHPTKTEIKFEQEQMIFQTIMAAVKEATSRSSDAGSIEFDNPGARDIPVMGTNFASYRPAVEPLPQADPDYDPFQAPFERPSYSSYVDKSQNYGPLFEETALPSEGIMLIQGKYILAQKSGSLMLVNIRRARERILYDRFLQALSADVHVSQATLFPVQVAVGVQGRLLFEENAELLTRMGFDIAPFGNDSVVVNAVPEGYSAQAAAVQSMIGDLQLILSENPSSLPGVMEQNMAAKLAFLGASGADNSLSPAQARSLLDSLLQRGNPEFTSSGRRVISIIGADELEKRFK